jgi:metal-responsive CopG/Arc/MetJ family transcriptional regulator
MPMRHLMRTYRLPTDTVEEFEHLVAPEQRSAIIADLLREWLEARRREQLRRDVIEGCREMAEIYLETEREYHPLEEEAHQALGYRHRPRKGERI